MSSPDTSPTREGVWLISQLVCGLVLILATIMLLR